MSRPNASRAHFERSQATVASSAAWQHSKSLPDSNGNSFWASHAQWYHGSTLTRDFCDHLDSCQAWVSLLSCPDRTWASLAYRCSSVRYSHRSVRSPVAVSPATCSTSCPATPHRWANRFAWPCAAAGWPPWRWPDRRRICPRDWGRTIDSTLSSTSVDARQANAMTTADFHLHFPFPLLPFFLPFPFHFRFVLNANRQAWELRVILIYLARQVGRRGKEFGNSSTEGTLAQEERDMRGYCALQCARYCSPQRTKACSARRGRRFLGSRPISHLAFIFYDLRAHTEAAP